MSATPKRPSLARVLQMMRERATQRPDATAVSRIPPAPPEPLPWFFDQETRNVNERFPGRRT